MTDCLLRQLPVIGLNPRFQMPLNFKPASNHWPKNINQIFNKKWWMIYNGKFSNCLQPEIISKLFLFYLPPFVNVTITKVMPTISLSSNSSNIPESGSSVLISASNSSELPFLCISENLDLLSGKNNKFSKCFDIILSL